MKKMDDVFEGVVAPQDIENNAPIAQIVEEEKEPAYKVYGHEIFIEDETIKKYYQTSMKLLVFSNLLVGRFDDKGNYIISKEIKRDLVVMDKEIEEEGDKFFKAANIYMKKNFYYYVSLALQPDGKAKAALYLYEYVGDFLDKEFLVSHIANFVDTYDQDFRGKVRKAFNLVDVDVPNNDFTTPNLAILMQRMIDDKLRAFEMYEVMCQAYVMRMLKALEGSEKGRAIIEEYKKLLAKAGKGKLSWLKQKAILDRVVNRLGGYERLAEDLVDTKSLLAEANKQYEEIERKKAAVEILDTPEKGEKKEEKKAAPKKAAGKKAAPKKAAPKKAAGKKAGKKAAAKKDEKKKGSGVSLKELAEIAKKVAKEYDKLYGKSSAKGDAEKKAKINEEKKPLAKEEQKPQVIKPRTDQVDEDEFDNLLDDHAIRSSNDPTAVIDPSEVGNNNGGEKTVDPQTQQGDEQPKTVDPNATEMDNSEALQNVDPKPTAEEKGKMATEMQNIPPLSTEDKQAQNKKAQRIQDGLVKENEYEDVLDMG